MKSFKEKIEKEIINNRTRQSLDLISEYIKKNKHSDFSADVVLIKSNLNRLNTENTTGQITLEELGRRKSQIHSSILNLLQRIVSETNESVIDLVLVDVSYLTDNSGEEYNKIDLKLVNRGSRLVYIKKAKFKIKKKWYFKGYEEVSECSAYYPSENYHVKFTEVIPNNEININLSQVIKPNEEDRFTFELGGVKLGLGYHIYLFNIELIYNENNCVLLTPSIFFFLEENEGGRSYFHIIDEKLFSFAKKKSGYKKMKDWWGLSKQNIFKEYENNFQALNEITNIQSIMNKPMEKFIIQMKENFKKTIESQPSTQSSRDKTKYFFNGKKLGKGKLVLEVVSEYLKQNPNSTFEHLLAKFPADIQGSIGVINTVEYINEKYKHSSRQRHFMKESEILTSFDNVAFAVSTEWGIGNINSILDLAAKENYNIEEKKMSDN